MEDDGKRFWTKIKNCGYKNNVTIFTNTDVNKT